MTAADFSGTGTAADPWVLQTPSLRGGFEMYRAEDADPPALVCTVGSTELRYHLSAIDDLHQMLKDHGDWMPLGSADEQKPAKDGTVESWGRSPDNPVGGWYGLKKGLRGSIWQLPTAAARGPWPRRGRTQSPRQPDAGALGR